LIDLDSPKALGRFRKGRKGYRRRRRSRRSWHWDWINSPLIGLPPVFVFFVQKLSGVRVRTENTTGALLGDQLSGNIPPPNYPARRRSPSCRMGFRNLCLSERCEFPIGRRPWNRVLALMSAGKPLDTPITFGREPGDFGVGDSLVCANFVSGSCRVTRSRSDGVDDRSMGGESPPSTPAMKEFKE
jgi:hypothetical protein